MSEEEDRKWQSCLTNLSERISYLRSSKKWADLTINFPEHKKSIKAHRWMLALSSPVFEVMMFGPLAEGEVLSLPDDSPEAFEWLLDHLYCDQRNLPNMEMAIEVFKLAHKYQIQYLCCLCSEYLCKRVNAENLPLLYKIADMYEEEDFLERCEKILSTESDEVLLSNGIPKLSFTDLDELLGNENLKPSSGLVMLKCIHRWGKAELRRKSADSSDIEGGIESSGQSGKKTDMAPSSRSLRECVERLLIYVDFPTLSVDEFVEHVLPTGIFSPEESMSILQRMKGVKEITLPSCVLPWTLKSMVLKTSKRAHHKANNTDGLVFTIQSSTRIILHEIETCFSKYTPEGELLIHNDKDKVVSRGILTRTGCIFPKPVNLEAEKVFRISVIKRIYFEDWGHINAESGRIKITGEAVKHLDKLAIKFSVLAY